MRFKYCWKKVVFVHSVVYPDAPPREFSIDNPERCHCEKRLVENDQCDYEIKLYDGFRKHLFEERHFARERVTGSLTGWEAPPNDKTEIILGVADDLDKNSHEVFNLFENELDDDECVEASLNKQLSQEPCDTSIPLLPPIDSGPQFST